MLYFFFRGSDMVSFFSTLCRTQTEQMGERSSVLFLMWVLLLRTTKVVTEIIYCERETTWAWKEKRRRGTLSCMFMPALLFQTTAVLCVNVNETGFTPGQGIVFHRNNQRAMRTGTRSVLSSHGSTLNIAMTFIGNATLCCYSWIADY